MGVNIIAPLEYSGTKHGDFFEAWFEEHLLPALPEDEIAERHRRKIIFLPPYSPELNPIEHFWHWLKKTTGDCLKFCSELNLEAYS